MNTFEVQFLHVLKFNLQILRSSYVIFLFVCLDFRSASGLFVSKMKFNLFIKRVHFFIFGKVHHVCAMFSVLLFVCCGAEPPSK